MRKFYEKTILNKIKPRHNPKQNGWGGDLFDTQKDAQSKKSTHIPNLNNNFKMVMHHGKQKLLFGMSLYIAVFMMMTIIAVRDIINTQESNLLQTYHAITQDFYKLSSSFEEINSDVSMLVKPDKNIEVPPKTITSIDYITKLYPYIDAFYFAELKPNSPANSLESAETKTPKTEATTEATTEAITEARTEARTEELSKVVIHNFKIYNSDITGDIYNLYSKIIANEIIHILESYPIKNAGFYYFNTLNEKSAYYIMPIKDNNFLFLRINQKYFTNYYSKNNVSFYFKNKILEMNNADDRFIFTMIKNIDYLSHENVAIPYIQKLCIYFAIFVILNFATILGYRALCSYYIAMTKIGLLTNELKIISKNKSGSETRMQHLIESTNIVPWTANPDTHTFTYIGQQIVEMTGIRYDAWLTTGFWLSHIHKDDHTILFKAINDVKNNVYVSAEYRIYDNFGDIMWLRNTISKQSYYNEDNEKEKIMLQGFITDITNQKMALETLDNARLTAEKASEMKSNFLASMSHELRTPLNSIIGFADIIHSMNSGNHKIIEYSENILLSGKHLLDLINDILDYSKIEAGEFEIRIEPTPIVDIFKACQTLLQNRADTENISLLVKYPNENILMNADPVRIKQVLINLLTNAIKFNRPKGKVALVCEMNDAGELILKVTDTGIGMKPEDLKIALEKFRQVDGSKNRQQEGTGLGLSISKSLVELHGGDLNIKSIYGKGTQVIMTFPPNIIYVHNQNKNSA